MVTTRRSSYNTIVEEKKDDDDLVTKDASNFSSQYLSGQPKQLIKHPQECTRKVNAKYHIDTTQKKSPLFLLLCASGITSCYLWYGTVQETLNSSTEKESITLFLLATGTFSSSLLASLWILVRNNILSNGSYNGKAGGKLNHILLVFTSTAYLSAMAASNESLHYVSYPTCVLAKSSKLIPTMVVGWLVDKIRGQCSHGGPKVHSIMEWVGAAFITLGILSFQYTQLQKQESNHGGKSVKGDSPYGLFLLGLSLFMDGVLGACQSALKRKSIAKPKSSDKVVFRSPTAMETMLYINLYATIILLPTSYYFKQFQNGMKMLLEANGEISKLLLQLNLSASLGQVFVFLTIHHFSPLICTTITTTRKFFTILLSVYKFGHVLDAWQWSSVGLVFAGLYLEIAAKIVGQNLDVMRSAPHPSIHCNSITVLLSKDRMVFLPSLLVAFNGALFGRSRQIYAFSQMTTLHQHHASLFSTLYLSDDVIMSNDSIQPIDSRPYEQRVSIPRQARRLNHNFQYLYRHFDPRWDDNDWIIDQWSNDKEFLQNVNRIFGSMDSNSTTVALPMNQNVALSAIHYLHIYGGYSLEEIQELHSAFPPLFEIDVMRHLRPKMRFLKDCMKGGTKLSNEESERQVLNPRLKRVLPASFFGARFERTIAPRHAFLVHSGLPCGSTLWNTLDGDKSLFEEFLFVHRKPKQFAAMCNKWKSQYLPQRPDNTLPITSEQIVAFDKLFQRGMLSAARNDTAYAFPDEKSKIGVDSSLMTTANVTSAQLIRYLIQHGSNPYEEDVRGASLFHWAAGCGNLDALNELIKCCNELDFDRTTNSTRQAGAENAHFKHGIQAALLWKASRDDATPLHWAASGAGPKEFGIGGHVSICSYLLELCKHQKQISERKLINSKTKDGNTVLMWAAWSRSLDIVKLLARNRADTTTCNRNGCSVAHWAASGGSLSVCKYLAEITNVDFSVENYAGNTPLSHAVAYGRAEVVKWLREQMKVDDKEGIAADLAMDFISWADSGIGLIGEEEKGERRKVYDLFKEWNYEMGEVD